MIDYLWLLIAIPLLGSLTLILFGRRFGEPAAGWFASALVVIPFFFALAMALPFIGGAESETVYVFSWIPMVGANASLLWDPLSALMSLIVTGVGALIHIYSVGYMHGDERYTRFFSYMNLFIASMMTLVLADNFGLMFVGWELVGLSSYLLISFWFSKPSAAAAGKKAFVVNRIGDWGFLVALMMIFAAFGTLDFGIVFSEAHGALTVGMATAITLLLFVGAAGKSAQIPLYIWLPDAMEGPTPVSALIHAATMVTAGVYMVARAAALFEMAPVSQGVVATVGALTALLAATIAIGQRDIKRVLAYSTVSQLGYMVMAVGLTAFTAGIFHLMTHAFFKALLFLGAGSVIHAMSDEQDMWKMGGLRKIMPITFGTMAIAWLAISGVFPFAGFWSKDEILGAAFGRGGGYLVLWAIGVLTAMLTAFYMTKLIIITFFGEKRWDKGAHPHESPFTMTIPLIVLAVFSAFAGLWNTPWRLGLEHFLEPAFEGVHQAHPPEGLALWTLALISLAVVAVGMFVAYLRYGRREELPVEEGGYWNAALNAYWVDDFYGKVIVLPGKAVATWLAMFFDMKVVDGIVNGLAVVTRSFGSSMRVLQTGWVRSYGAAIVAGSLGVILWLLLQGGAF
ncbi:MAG: NADH-quinone oxidoreductase subunit L [Actinomycetota bacterium]|nr:NADH-quinone oxidoreductase subunit L [Actinomycetota bacterium]